MPSLTSASAPKRFKLLQIAESGHGKTTRSLSATEFGKVYFFDLDEKLVATADNLPDEQKSLIDYDAFKSYDQVIAKLNELKKTNPYQTIVLDTWSRLYDLMTDKFFGKKVKLDFDDWNLIKVTQKEFLTSFLSLNSNIIINTHIGRKEDAQGRTVLTVGTSGTFGQTLPQYFNETHCLTYDSIAKAYKVQGARSSNFVVNTAMKPETMDDKGFFKSADLSIFSNIAQKETK